MNTSMGDPLIEFVILTQRPRDTIWWFVVFILNLPNPAIKCLVFPSIGNGR